MHLNSVSVYLFPGTYLKVQTVRGALKHRFPNFSCASFLLCAAVLAGHHQAMDWEWSSWQCSVTTCLLFEGKGGGEETGLDTESLWRACFLSSVTAVLATFQVSHWLGSCLVVQQRSGQCLTQCCWYEASWHLHTWSNFPFECLSAAGMQIAFLFHLSL